MKTSFCSAVVAAALAAPALAAVVKTVPTESGGYQAKAGLYVYPARTRDAEPARLLMEEDIFCPDDKATILCMPVGSPEYAEFYIDGEASKKEKIKPYILTGDRDGYAREWSPSGPATVKCVTSDGEEVSSKLTISCDKSEVSPSTAGPSQTSTAALATTEAAQSHATEPVVGCKRPVTMSPSSSAVSPAGEGTTSPVTVPVTKPATMEPATVAMTKPVTDPVTTTTLATEPATQPMATKATMPATVSVTKPATKPMTTAQAPATDAPVMTTEAVTTAAGKLCQRIPATGYRGSTLPEGWSPKNGGIVYKEGGDGKIDKAPTSDDQVLSYDFTAMHDGYHAITMDTYAPKSADHNDMFIQFKDGLTRRKGDAVKPSTTDWLKAYQNTAKRSWGAKTTDHYGDSFSTSIKLIKGEKYTINVAGRSTKFILYNLGVFPCNGKTCAREDDYFRKTEATCEK